MTIYIVFIFIIMYIICMFSPAITICKLKTGQDIRKLGSMEASTNNAIKVLGRLLGSFIGILNILKIILAYIVALKLANFLDVDTATNIFKSCVILACLTGHCFPAVYNFNGGKGIIEFITLMSIFDHKYVIICVVIGIVITAITKVLAKGAISSCLFYLLISIILGCNYLPALVMSLLIILFKYKENIVRILQKQEEKIK